MELSKEQNSLASSFEAQGATVIFIARAQRLAGLIVLSDEPKPEAAAVVRLLEQRGAHVWMASGDHESTVKFMAAKLGITDYIAGVNPQDKARHVKELQVGATPSPKLE